MKIIKILLSILALLLIVVIGLYVYLCHVGYFCKSNSNLNNNTAVIKNVEATNTSPVIATSTTFGGITQDDLAYLQSEIRGLRQYIDNTFSGAGYLKGEKGDTGDTGPQGPKGDKGDAGVSSTNTTTNWASVYNPPGQYQFVPVSTGGGGGGSQGPAGPQGPAGANGATGPAGANGLDGSYVTLITEEPTTTTYYIYNPNTNATSNLVVAKANSYSLSFSSSTGLLSLNANGEVASTTIDITSGSSNTYTASNGLTMNGNDVQLGGTLTKKTQINSNGFPVFIGDVGGILSGGANSLGIGYGSITSGVNSLGSGRLNIVSGDNAAAFGNYLKSDSFAGTVVGQYNKYDDYSPNSTGFSLTNRAFQIGIGTGQGALTKNAMTVLFSGKTTLNQYGSGAFTGTPTYSLAVDANGNIIETPVSGGGSSYTFSNGLTEASGSVMLGGALTGNTTIDNPSNYYLKIANGGNNYFQFSTAGGSSYGPTFTLFNSSAIGVPSFDAQPDQLHWNRYGIDKYITGNNLASGGVTTYLEMPNKTSGSGNAAGGTYYIPISVTVNGVTTYAGLNGDIDLGTISGGGSTSPAGNSSAIQYNGYGAFAGNENQLAWDNDNKRLFIGSPTSSTPFDNTAYGQLNILATSPSGGGGNSYNQQFMGSGLNDATFSGTYSGGVNPSYPFTMIAIVIAAPGNPDQFVWYETHCNTTTPSGPQDCDSAPSPNGPISITGSSQSLVDGISVTFTATTGHTPNDQWMYTISSSIPTYDPVINVVRDDETPLFIVDQNGNAKLGGGIYDSISSLGGSGQILSSTGNGLAWVNQLKGAINYYPDSGSYIGQNAGPNGNGSDSGQDNNIHIGVNAGLNANNVYRTIFLGEESGLGATDVRDSIFLGDSSGYNATDAYQSNFFGGWAGENATNADNSNFLGYFAGNGAINANDSNFFGEYSGRDATEASNSNFIGGYAGNGATSASNSNFFGGSAGRNATNAANSIFIGNDAGYNDTVNNTPFSDETSILIGDHTSTGGYSKSIALGAQGTNTMSNQFLVAPSYNNWQIAGVNYVMPSSQAAGSGYVLTNDGSGNLSWATSSGSGTSSINYINGYGGKAGYGSYIGKTSGYNSDGTVGTGSFGGIFIGDKAGGYAYSSPNSSFLGYGAGYNAYSSGGTNFIGTNAGAYAYTSPNSNYIGTNAGFNANNSFSSNFLGYGAGFSAINAANSIFLGTNAGQYDSVNNTSNNGYSILIGPYTGTGGKSNSIAIGYGAKNTTANQFMIGSRTRNINQVVIAGTNSYLNFGYGGYGAAGYGFRDNNGTIEYKGYGGSWSAISSSSPIAISTNGGDNIYTPGLGAAEGSSIGADIFLGINAGRGTTQVDSSNFIGYHAGYGAEYSGSSNFIGYNSGLDASSSNTSNFLGYYAGHGASNSIESNFFGDSAGENSASSSYSNFIGYYTGNGAINSNYSNLFGYQAGMTFASNNIGSNNIIIGTNISLPNTAANSLNLGGVLFGTGSYNTTTGDPSILPTSNGSIGIGVVTPGNRLEIANNSLLANGYSGLRLGLTNASTSLGSTTKVLSVDANGDVGLFDMGGGGSSRFGIEDNIGVQNRSIDMQNHDLNIFNSSNILFGEYPNNNFDSSYSSFNKDQFDTYNANSWDGATGTIGVSTRSYGSLGGISTANPSTASMSFSTDAIDSLGRELTGGVSVTSLQNVNNVSADYVYASLGASYDDNGHGLKSGYASVFVQSSNSSNGSLQFQVSDGTNSTEANFPFTVGADVINKFIPLSVNGNYADSEGNITVPSGGISLTDLSATAPLTYSTTTGVFGITQASSTSNGFLSSTDWSTFNNKQNSLISGTNIKTINGISLLGSGDMAIGNSLALQTNGTTNGTSTLLNLIAGSNISLIDNGSGGITISASGSPITVQNTGSLFSTGLTNPAGVGSGVNYSIFLGSNAGYNAYQASTSNFIGDHAGYEAASSSYSNFFGSSAGSNATSSWASNFIGMNAGQNAYNSSGSNFIGYHAGNGAYNSNASNFFAWAGENANNAHDSNFFGYKAGYYAANSAYSNFFGSNAGSNATNTTYSNFFGYSAGSGVSNVSNSNFFGQYTSQNATNTSYSNFFGFYAGQNANNTHDSNFFGTNSGSNANNAHHSNFFGPQAGQNASSSNSSNFFGDHAGSSAAFSEGSNFFGYYAGESAINAGASNFFGNQAGRMASNAQYSNFFGNLTGQNAESSSNSNFFGPQAGQNASSSSQSNFFGNNAGQNASNSYNSNFIGGNAGQNASSSPFNNFIGINSGQNVFGSSYNNLIGYNTGTTFSGNNIGNNNIIIGSNVSLPNGTSNAINLGGVLFGTGAYNTTTGNPTTTAVVNGKIGIGTSTPVYTLDVGNSTIPGIVAQFTNSVGACTINPTTTSLSCSSDINLKKNITTLNTGVMFSLAQNSITATSSVLDKINALIPVKYNWKVESDADAKHAGFIAQQVEQIFPDLVSTNSSGKSVNYIGFVPYLTEALQEMSAKFSTDVSTTTIIGATSTIDMTVLPDNTVDTGFTHWVRVSFERLSGYFFDMVLKVKGVFTHEVHTEKLCVGNLNGDETCVDKTQLDNLLNRSTSGSGSVSGGTSGSVNSGNSNSSSSTQVNSGNASTTNTGNTQNENSTSTVPVDNSSASTTVESDAQNSSGSEASSTNTTPAPTTPVISDTNTDSTDTVSAPQSSTNSGGDSGSTPAAPVTENAPAE